MPRAVLRRAEKRVGRKVASKAERDEFGMFVKLLRLLPAYYFCPEYLATVAACSRSMKQQVLDRNHWTGTSSRPASAEGYAQVVDDCSNRESFTAPTDSTGCISAELHAAVESFRLSKSG